MKAKRRKIIYLSRKTELNNKEKRVTFYWMSLSKYNAPLLLRNILLRIIKMKIQEISERGKNLKKNPKLQSLDAPSLLLCRRFVGDIGSRVLVQLSHETT